MQFPPKHPSELFQALGPEIFSTIQSECGLGGEGFRRLYLPPAERLALVVQQLPLIGDAFSYEGGGLSYGLMAASMALRLSSSTIFRAGVSAAERATLTPQYRWAAYVATLCCVPIQVFHCQEISVPGSLWTPWDSSRTLFEVAQTHGGYSVAWLQQAEPLGKAPSNLAIAALAGFIYPGMLAGLERGVVRDFCAAINPSLQRPPVESPLGSVVRRAQELILNAEGQRRAAQVSSKTPGMLDISAVVGAVATPPEATPASNHVTEQPQSAAPSSVSGGPRSIPAPQESPAAQSVEAGTGQSIPGNVLAWVRALVGHEPLKNHVEVLLNGDVKISKQALGFGQPAGKNYEALHKAGLVVSKMTEGVICNKHLAMAFEQARGSSKKAGE